MKKLLLTAALVSLLPLAAHARPHGGKMLKHMDTNKDGKISQEEFIAGHNKRFSKTDKNNNGFIETNEAKHPKAKRLLKHADIDNDGMVSKEEFRQKNTERFQTMDANNDGFVSAEEGRNAARTKRFERLDKNGDGQISKEEFMAAKRLKKKH